MALPHVASIRPTELTALASSISRAAGEIDNTGQLTVNTDMPQLLTNAFAGLATARSLILIGGLQLLLLAGAALALASRLLASYLEEETAILAARGAARGQLIRLSLAEAALGTAIGAAAGVIVGGYLSAVLQAHLTGLRQPAVVHGLIVWIPAAALAVLALGFVIWPTIRPPRPGDARIRRGRAAPRRTVAIRDGRTSSETLRHEAADELGNSFRHAVEYAVLDRAGRVQLPREMVDQHQMRDRVLLESQADHIAVWPDRPGGPDRADRPDHPGGPDHANGQRR